MGMLGIEGAINLVLARLQAEMPAKTLEVAARFPGDLTTMLRPPASYVSSMYTRKELAQFPMLEVAPRQEGPPSWNTQVNGSFDYRWPYQVRVYMTERGQTFAQVEARRQRLTLAIKEVLTSSPQLQASPLVWIDNTSLRTVYFGTGSISDGDNRSIAATFTDLTVIVEEMTEPATPNLGVADTILSSVHPANQ